MFFWRSQVNIKASLFRSATILSLLILPITQAIADDILAQINKQLMKAPLTQGQFKQEKRLKYLTKPLISNGIFTYHQSKGVIWQTQSPVQSTLVMSDTAMLIGEEKAEDRQQMPPAFGTIFKAILGGEISALNQNFTVTGKQQGQMWTLELKPNSEMLRKVINTITVSGDNEVRDWELHETGGNLTRIHFSEITHPERLSPKQQTDFERLSP